MTHPHNLAAAAALRSLTEAQGWLADVIHAAAWQRPDLGPRRTTRRSARALAAEDETRRTEREERVHADRAGIRQAGASPGPIPEHLLDARMSARVALEHVAWIVSSSLARHPLVTGWRDWAAIAPAAAPSAYLAAVLGVVDPRAALNAAEGLEGADESLRRVLGVGPSRVPIDATCPACGGYTLTAEVSEPDNRLWTVECGRASCRCAGRVCPCRIPLREEGTRHIWPAGSIIDLARIAGRRAAA